MKIKEITFFIIVIVTIGMCNDLDFRIYKNNIEIVNKPDTVKMELKNITGLEKYLQSVFSQFSEDVKNGKRQQTYNGISVKIIDTITYKEMVDALFLISLYCDHSLKNIEILNKNIKVCVTVNMGYNCWKESKILILNNNNYEIKHDSLAQTCSDNKIRVLADATTKIDNVLNKISELTNTDSSTYQFCFDKLCTGCNGPINDKEYFNNLK
jgi:hypothetical protein